MHEVNRMNRPAPLFPGARVALVAPSSAVPEGLLARANELVCSLGLNPVFYPSCRYSGRDGYLAATDAQRAQDIMHAFENPAIDGVWCARGGYGAHRILPLLDAASIRKHPKWFGGYSDVTALHTFLNQKCNLETFHIPMPASKWEWDAITLDGMKKALFGGLTGALENPEGHAVKTLVPGQARGRLCGGNLSLLAASMGTPWEIDTRGKILFLEDVNEKTYRLDSMLTQLRNGGKFDDCAGIVLGYWTDCEPEDPDCTLELDEIFRQLIVPAGKPAISGFACGHSQPSLALPLGRLCVLDAAAGTVCIEED